MTTVRSGAPAAIPLGAAALPSIEAISRRAFDPRFGEAWSKAQCLATLSLPGYRLRGVEGGTGDQRLLVGFSIARAVADESELLLLAVDPAWRRQGFASALVGDWIDICRAEGRSRLFLEMRQENPARVLYARHGFVEIAIRQGYYRGTDGTLRDAVTMERVLDCAVD